MKVLILGNIGSGKTTISKRLQQEFVFHYCSVDDMRRLYGDRTVPKEYLALYHFLSTCSNTQDTILEFSGAGCHKFAVKKALEDSKDTVLIAILLVSVNICTQRITNRTWDIPFPSWEFQLTDHLKFIDSDLTSDINENFWSSSKLFTCISCQNEKKSDLEATIEEISSLIKCLSKKKG